MDFGTQVGEHSGWVMSMAREASDAFNHYAEIDFGMVRKQLRYPSRNLSASFYKILTPVKPSGSGGN
jgi:hypothetical protein